MERMKQKRSMRDGKKNKKVLNDLDNHDGVVTHLEPDIWSVKSSGP